MIFKILVRILLGNKDSVLRSVKINGKIYILKIERYESVEDTLESWKGCLDKDDLSKHS